MIIHPSIHPSLPPSIQHHIIHLIHHVSISVSALTSLHVIVPACVLCMRIPYIIIIITYIRTYAASIEISEAGKRQPVAIYRGHTATQSTAACLFCHANQSRGASPVIPYSVPALRVLLVDHVQQLPDVAVVCLHSRQFLLRRISLHCLHNLRPCA